MHFDQFGIPRYQAVDNAKGAQDNARHGYAVVEPDGTIDLTQVRTPVVIVFRVDPAEHHRFDRRAPLFTSDTPFTHTHRWRPDEQFRRVRRLDDGLTLRIDYQNINKKHRRPMPANGYDLSFSPGRHEDKDPAIKNSSATN